MSYPFLFEPLLRLRTQGSIWSGLYLLVRDPLRIHRVELAFRYPAGGIVGQRDRTAASAQHSGPYCSGWGFPPAVPRCWWPLPIKSRKTSPSVRSSGWQRLAIYLLTFVLAFESDRFYFRMPLAIALGLFAPIASALPSVSIGLSLRWQLLVYLIALFVTCMICQGELARSRPSSRYLTTFYLTIAAGGAMGGVFVASIAPRLFTEFSEYQIGLAAACLLGFVGWMRSGALARWTSRNLPCACL